MPPPSGNLIVNGGFERVGVEQSPEAWILKAWDGTGSGRVMPGGRFGRSYLRLNSASPVGLYGCHTQPIEVGPHAGHEMLLSLYYRTEGRPYADVVVVTFSDDFTEKEWNTPALGRDELPLDQSGHWAMLSRRVDVPPDARHALVVLRIAGEGSLCVDGVALRSLPGELACEVRSAGLVSDANARRTDLVLTNRIDSRLAGNVTVEIWDDNTRRGTVQRPFQLGGGQDQRISLDYPFDYRTAHRLRISVFGSQEQDVYDDLRVRVPALLDAKLAAPAFRTTMMAGVPPEAVIVTGRIHAIAELVRGTKVSGAIVGTAERGRTTQRIPLDDQGAFTVEMVPPSLASGPYEVSLNARVRNWSLDLDLPFSKAPATQQQVAYDHAGRLWAKGKAVFPIGMGYLWEPVDLKTVADAGFNFATVPARTASTAFMDQADKLGVGVFVSSASMERDFWANAWRKHGPRDSFWGWYILERPETHGASVRPELLESLFADLRELAPYHPVLCALSSSAGLEKFGPANDIVIAWAEPNPPGELAPVARHVSQSREMIDSGKPVWALVPIAGASHTRDRRLDPAGAGRAPTAAEYRAMVYLSIVCGAQGIVSYGYRIHGEANRREWLVTDDAPDLWQQVLTINRELSAVGLSILSGSRQLQPNDFAEPVQYGVWEHEEQAVVIVVNTTDEQQVGHLAVDNLTQPVLQSITRPDRLEGTAQGHFAQPLAPYEAVIYVGRLRSDN
jgi:hypothetical protein